jgi:nucleoside recognition membrane protein YjiH
MLPLFFGNGFTALLLLICQYRSGLYVRGNKVVITNNQGKIVTQFKNTRAETLDRVMSGKWKPVS